MATLFKTKEQALKEKKYLEKKGLNISVQKTDLEGFRYKIVSIGRKDKTYVDGHLRRSKGKNIWVTGHYRKL